MAYGVEAPKIHIECKLTSIGMTYSSGYRGAVGANLPNSKIFRILFSWQEQVKCRFCISWGGGAAHDPQNLSASLRPIDY